MARCPKCQKSFLPTVTTCPDDGAKLETRVVDSGAETVPGAQQPIEAVTVNSAAVSSPRFVAKVSARAAPVESEVVVGAMVGEYRITGTLGVGGMGSVFSGEHPVIGKRVAIKVLSPALSKDETMVQRFVQEARAVNQIGHPNIIDIFAFGELPSGRSYFVMEFLPGRSLKERLRSGPPLTHGEALAILDDVCAALSAAHGEGIIHRDLKPENLYLADSRSAETLVKLLDFGIAKLVRTGEDGLTRTGAGVVIGTPLYMSPEQCTGREVDARTDIYSLGVVMFELFTGQVPFPGPSYAETVNGHLSITPPSPRSPNVSESLDRLILGCLEKEPSARPQTIDEVRASLKAIALETASESAAQTLPPMNASEFVDRSRAAIATRAATGRDASTVKRGGVSFVTGGVVAAILVGVVALFLLRAPTPAPVVAPKVDPPMVELQVLSDPSGALVTLDGKRQTLRTPSLFRVPRASSLRVLVEKEGWKPSEQVVMIAPFEMQKAVVNALVPLRAPSGRLQIGTNVKRATWKLDGAPVGDGSGSLRIDDLAAGSHLVHVEAKGFAPHEEQVTLQGADVIALVWTLESGARPRKKLAPTNAAATTPAVTSPIDVNGTSGWPPH